MRLQEQRKRKASVLVEVALIMPVLVLIVAMAADVVSGVFRFHQVATLAREGARYASVHAGQYSADTGTPLLTGDQLKTSVMLPMSIGLIAANLSCQISWQPNGDSYPYTTTSTGSRKQNMVRVVVSYQWQPIFLLGRAITLTSTSESPISR
jgi:hypothetical protein